MRNREEKKTIAIIILAIIVAIWFISTVISNMVGTTDGTGNKDADKYDYGIPLQNVVDLHYMEMNVGSTTEDNYPVFKTMSDGWIVYIVQTKRTDERVTEVVFYGPEFWDRMKKGDMEDTSNWQE
jgi:hypothetical protein